MHRIAPAYGLTVAPSGHQAVGEGPVALDPFALDPFALEGGSRWTIESLDHWDWRSVFFY